MIVGIDGKNIVLVVEGGRGNFGRTKLGKEAVSSRGDFVFVCFLFLRLWHGC